MSAYVIAQLDVHDTAEFEKYLAGFYPIFERHGGRLVGRSLETQVMEGDWAMPRTVIMRFPTAEDARRWHDDPDYQPLPNTATARRGPISSWSMVSTRALWEEMERAIGIEPTTFSLGS